LKQGRSLVFSTNK